MKTLNNLRQYIPVGILSVILIASALGTNAQNRKNENKREDQRDRKEYRQSERTSNSEWRGRKNENRDNRNFESRNNRDEYRPKYSKRNYREQPNYFNHPKYGKVYRRFEHNPIVFGNQYGDYYYSGNNFYRYHDGVGYYEVAVPRHEYFRHLPHNCNRVNINGQVLFTNGELFFQLSPRGYSIVPSPIEVRFSARF